jgi:hypothetical protein
MHSKLLYDYCSLLNALCFYYDPYNVSFSLSLYDVFVFCSVVLCLLLLLLQTAFKRIMAHIQAQHHGTHTSAAHNRIHNNKQQTLCQPAHKVKAYIFM